MRVGRLAHWFATGACFGLALDVWALGTLFLAGVILLVVGVLALRGREVVATVLGLGVGFAALLPLVAYTPFGSVDILQEAKGTSARRTR